MSKSTENTTLLYPGLRVVMFCTAQNRGMSSQVKLMDPVHTPLLARL
jgi:hypothetical protein